MDLLTKSRDQLLRYFRYHYHYRNDIFGVSGLCAYVVKDCSDVLDGVVLADGEPFHHTLQHV